MTFIQIVEMRSRDIDELRSLYERWEQATEGTATLRGSILTQDRSDPHQVTIIAFFDSYEAAMQNSGLPETTAWPGRPPRWQKVPWPSVTSTCSTNISKRCGCRPDRPGTHGPRSRPAHRGWRGCRLLEDEERSTPTAPVHRRALRLPMPAIAGRGQA
jgi:hypothetical protein